MPRTARLPPAASSLIAPLINHVQLSQTPVKDIVWLQVGHSLPVALLPFP
jgi:hypothetical protein